MQKVMSFDPGYNTGWVYWEDRSVKEHGTIRLSGKRKDLTSDVQHISILSGDFNKLLFQYRPTEVVIEGVSLWGNSAKSQAAALRGDTFWLAYLVGSYLTLAFMNDIKVTLVDVRTWKGSIPLEALQKWVQHQTGLVLPNEHEYCATGIGLHYFGKM